MNNKALVLFLLVCFLLFGALLTRQAALLWLAFPILAYLGVGVWLSRPVGSIRLEASRSANQLNEDGTASVEVAVLVRNAGNALPYIRLEDPAVRPGDLLKGRPAVVGALQSGGEGSLEYAFRTERGSFAWDTLRVVACDPLGLVETVLDLPAAAKIQVRPEVQRIRPFPVRSRRTLHSAGAIPARLGGSGTDFWGVREYYPGDSLRRLDWRRTARHPGTLFTKEFEQEEIADIGLILDGRAKMDLKTGSSSLFEHSARAAAALAELFLRQGNRVSLLVHGTPQTWVFPGYGKRQLDHILRGLAAVRTETEGNLESLQFLPIQMFSSNSLVIVISPLSVNDWVLFPRLRAHGFQTLLISPDPLDFAREGLAPDRLTGLAARLTQAERQLEMRKITQLWIPVIDWQVSRPIAPLVRQALGQSLILCER